MNKKDRTLGRKSKNTKKSEKKRRRKVERGEGEKSKSVVL